MCNVRTKSNLKEASDDGVLQTEMKSGEEQKQQ
jgi:hypothetical protein